MIIFFDFLKTIFYYLYIWQQMTTIILVKLVIIFMIFYVIKNALEITVLKYKLRANYIKTTKWQQKQR